ncbi:hypothetical protein [Pseudomonas palleroniana]
MDETDSTGVVALFDVPVEPLLHDLQDLIVCEGDVFCGVSR